MKIAELVRLEESEEGTFGVLKIDKEVFCCTLEPSDNENISSISSIPAQQYMCEPYTSIHHGETFRVTSVPQRTYILFHGGNTKAHTEGCILLGQYFGKLRGGERAVLNSGNTMRKFLALMGKEPFHLTIQEKF